MEEEDRKRAYTKTVGQLTGEGFIHEPSIKHALGLNPETPTEKAMKVDLEKNPLGLIELATDIEEKQKAFAEGYFEGMPKEPLPEHEMKELQRRIYLVKSGTGSVDDLESQKLELRVYAMKLLQSGYKIDDPDIVKNLREIGIVEEE